MKAQMSYGTKIRFSYLKTVLRPWTGGSGEGGIHYFGILHWAFLGVSLIEYNGTYFRVGMEELWQHSDVTS